MGFNPGRNVGRLSIRVVPDTTQFSRDLRNKLKPIEKLAKFQVTVDRANVDRKAIRADVKKKLTQAFEGYRFNGASTDVDVQAKITKAKIAKKQLQKSLQDQFDNWEALVVKLAPELHETERFLKEVDRLVNKASRKDIKIPVQAQTAAATAHLKWVSRTRFVDLIVRVNKASAAKALTTLAALSGARLAGNWIDDIATSLKNLDKNLPSILAWTTGLTSLFAAITAGTGGLVGIGQGLYSILPALLVVPGLFINAVASVSALIVALKDAKKELGVLGPQMTSLGELISDTFWSRARDPIIDLTQSLMPQLRSSFEEVTAGIGDFTAAFANAFKTELSDGKLESIFGGIAEGWRELAKGAPGFAGAIVSLSQIAATYTPRLARWFTRQADTFDSWLKKISTDGRLSRWMEDAIDSMYDVWDVARGLGGVFSGLWTAAEAAGSTGLHGFAQLMLKWSDIVNDTKFQKGMTAVFRGASTAMEAFSGAIVGIGDLIYKLNGPIERFIGGAGKFAGGLIEAIAGALSSPKVGAGLDGLTEGLLKALDGIKPSLQPIADAFGGLLGFVGTLAAEVIPTAVDILAQLAPTFEKVLDLLEPMIGPLTDALSGFVDKVAPALESAIDTLAPAFEEMAKALTPVLVEALDALAEALVQILPVAGELASALADGIGDFSKGFTAKSSDDRKVDNANSRAGELIRFSFEGGAFKLFDILADPKKAFAAAWRGEMGLIAKELIMFGLCVGEAFDDIWEKIEGFFGGLPEMFAGLPAAFSTFVGNLGTSLALGFETAKIAVTNWFVSLPEMVTDAIGDAAVWLLETGSNVIVGMLAGIKIGWESITAWFATIGQLFLDLCAGAITWLTTTGTDTLQGLLDGIVLGWEKVKAWFAGLPGLITSAIGDASGWLAGTGASMMEGLVGGISKKAGEVAEAARSAVSKAVNAAENFLNINSPSRVTRDVLGKPMAEGIAVGIDKKADMVAQSMRAAVTPDPKALLTPFNADDLGLPGDGASSGGVLGARKVIHQENHFEHADPEVAVQLVGNLASAALR